MTPRTTFTRQTADATPAKWGVGHALPGQPRTVFLLLQVEGRDEELVIPFDPATARRLAAELRREALLVSRGGR